MTSEKERQLSSTGQGKDESPKMVCTFIRYHEDEEERMKAIQAFLDALGVPRKRRKQNA